ncbi:polyprenyl synthetase family protein [Corynebacterium sp. H113]|uniref:polyprenyl synthetase family protein n=1 Tax=Corynebacterium sp. H113 TaxID=3133419 RepID=UPI0030AC9F86
MVALHIHPDMALKDIPATVTSVLASFFEERSASVAAIDPAFTMVVDSLKDFTLNGGKRVRPSFAWAGWLGAGGNMGTFADAEDPEAVFRAVCALEFIQACALVHDDIIDDSDTRRGAPTIHRIYEDKHAENSWRGSSAHYGRSVAILAGDVALAWADDMMHSAGLTHAAIDRVWEPWWRMRTEVLGGQLLDITAEASGDSRIEVAEKVNLYKTAAYTIARPLHIGGAIAGATTEILDAYRTFGQDIGIAFQLRDDQLGVFGDPKVTGKPAGDDLREGKRTVLVSTAITRLQESDPAGAQRLDDALGNVRTPAEISELTELIRASGADELVEKEIERLTNQGLAAIDVAPIVDTHKQRLIEMGKRATARAK